jgi:hypothetical protein
MTTTSKQIATADPKYFDCPTLDTDLHIEESLGSPIALPDHIDDGKWVSEQEPALLRLFAKLTHNQYEQVHRDNTYNSDNDFSSNFVFSIFAPVGCSDWCYCDDLFVTIEKHLGGDVRGNYGDAKVYRVGNIAESGFLDWVVGWYAEPIADDYDSEWPELQRLNERFCIGYSSWPTGEVGDALISKKPEWSTKFDCYVARLVDVPFPVKLRPVSSYYC